MVLLIDKDVFAQLQFREGARVFPVEARHIDWRPRSKRIGKLLAIRPIFIEICCNGCLGQCRCHLRDENSLLSFQRADILGNFGRIGV